MKEQIESIRKNAEIEIANAKDLQTLNDVRVKYLGKKGELTAVLRGMGGLSEAEKPIVGSLVNEVRDILEDLISKSEKAIKEEILIEKLKTEKIDVTMPSKKIELGTKHPITKVIDEVKEIFIGLGYEIADGPEVEYGKYNFDKLNIPEDHPARDLKDSFYITDDILLRTETSAVQARVMEAKKPPIRAIVPGTVYRSDSVDATHSPVFHQVEGLVVDKNLKMSDLKGTLETFIKSYLGKDVQVRFRPHYFPFTEPSAEMDVTCFVCKGKGCRVCKGEGFIEILGCGMVHEKVLRNCGIDPEEYTGFAFAFGVERIAMAKYNINDLRLLYENDVRFLKQF